jgi:outer membrane scaffolding protein for murein synthesis (MipA/OmpV family)
MVFTGNCMSLIVKTLSLALLAWAGAQAHAQPVPPVATSAPATAPTPAPEPAPALPLWEVGVLGVGVSQQAYPGADQQKNTLGALPYVVYRGKWLRADSDTVGLRAVKTPRLTLDVGFSGALGSSSADLRARQGMPNLGTLVEFGPRLRVELSDPAQRSQGRWRLDLPVRGVFDLSNGFKQRGMSFEPRLVFDKRVAAGTNVSASVSAVWGNQRLNDTLYGVAAPYATAARPAYLADSGLVALRAGLSASVALTPDWQLFTYARIDSVAGAANRQSPLVMRNTGTTVGIGLSYTLARSSRSAFSD